VTTDGRLTSAVHRLHIFNFFVKIDLNGRHSALLTTILYGLSITHLKAKINTFKGEIFSVLKYVREEQAPPLPM
jgi:hypothetical protein